QYEVNNAFDDYRFVVISAGRQSGKTFLGIYKLFQNSMEKPNSVNWWVSPTYTNSKIAFRRLVTFLHENRIGHHTNRADLRIDLDINKAAIEFKSADREEGLRGETVDFMVIDEMGMIKRDAWQFALRGTITITEAQVMFIGTPKGKNLFYELYTWGMDKLKPDYVSFQFDSKASPYFSDEEWNIVSEFPERIFRQEYQAEFLDDGGEVFRNIRDCIKGPMGNIPFTPKNSYYAGVDLGKSVDFSVICILDNYGHLVFYDRFKDVDWSLQKPRIVNACGQYRAFTKMDSTGLGDPILSDVMRSGIAIQGFKFSNISKRQLIEKLAMAIERAEITFPEIP
ncbi:MAG: hypothetical protein GY861_00800, partial [bacterium]|nr:hypothetical protein [bacterium]